MKKILVPTDFSACSKIAADTAVSLAKSHKVEIHFLHLMAIPIDWVGLNKLEQEKMYPDISLRVKEVNNALDGLVNNAESEGVTAKKFLHYNESYDFIITHAASQDIDLIIMGSHGSGGLKETFIGSNTQRIVRLSEIPVLVVKNKVLDKLTNIVFASEFEEANTKNIRDLLQFASLTNAKVHLLFVNTPFNFTDSKTSASRMKVMEDIYPDAIASLNIYNAFDFESGLEEFARGIGAEMIVMATHGRKGLDRVFSGSLTESAVNHLSIPLMSLRIG